MAVKALKPRVILAITGVGMSVTARRLVRCVKINNPCKSAATMLDMRQMKG